MIEVSRARWVYVPVLAAGLLLLTPNLAFSQANTATLHGSVTDPSGAVVANSKVTLTNEGTRAVMTQESGSGGEYVFPFVPPASYTSCQFMA